MSLTSTEDFLAGARILSAERDAVWLKLVTDRGEIHLAGGRVRLDLMCERCREQRLVEVVTTAGREHAFCAVCSHSWPIGCEPVAVGPFGYVVPEAVKRKP